MSKGKLLCLCYIRDCDLTGVVQDRRQTSVETEDTIMNGLGAVAPSVQHTAGLGKREMQAQDGLDMATNKTNFYKIADTPTSYEGISVSLYKSRQTGLKVMIANVEMPLVCLTPLLSLMSVRYPDISLLPQRFSTTVAVLMYCFQPISLICRRLNI